MQATGVKAFHLSIQQAHLWPFQQESSSYRAQCAVLLRGPLNMAVFQDSLQCLIRQHTILRTGFRTVAGMDVPLQMVASHVAAQCSVIDMESLSEVEQCTQIDACFIGLQQERFDLGYASLFYTSIFRLSNLQHLLFISLPALCADSSTLQQIVSDLRQIYHCYLNGENFNEESLQYVDVSAWQNKLLLSEDAEFPRQYWRKIELSQSATAHLPFVQGENIEPGSLDKKQDRAFVPGILKIPLEEGLAEQISKQVQHYDVSISAWLLACWRLVLWRLNDKADLVIGVACNGRNYEELIGAPGLYTRFVPVHLRLADDLPFEQLITMVHRSLQEASKWQAYFSWEQANVVEDSNIVPPFFPVSFEYDSWNSIFNTDDLVLSLSHKFSCTEPFLLKLNILQVGNQLQLEIHYDPRYVKRVKMERLSSVLHTVLQNVGERPEAALGCVPLLGKIQQEELLRLGEGPRRPQPACLWHQLVEQQARLHPQWPAVLDREQQWSYQQLTEQANQLARGLQQRGVGPGVLVGLYLERGGHQLLALLAILKAGGAYLPLDPQTPSVRLQELLQESEPHLLLWQKELGEPCPGWQERALDWQQLQQECCRLDEHDLPASSTGQDLAYVIYTSGSTGRPKGVMIEQQNLLNYSLGLGERIGAQPGWQYATVSTLAADLGNTAIMAALASGGCVQVLDYETLSSAAALERWASEHPIDVLKIVPSHLSALLAGQSRASWLPRRALILGGEVFPVSLLEQLRALGGSCRIYNHYGPTETTVGVLMQEAGEQEGERMALGRPLSNSQVYVLDGQMQLVPTGVQGELYIGGAGVGRGYLGQGEQTAQRFVPDPYGPAGARLYRTGDLGKLNESGRIEFVGRADSQVKLRGYRIELAEIEVQLRSHPQVWDGCVLLEEDEMEHKRLVGYVVAHSREQRGAWELQAYLKERLPDYMIPSNWVWLERLPLTPNGKLDRQRLRGARGEDRPQQDAQSARSPLEEVLQEVWQELLGVPVRGVQEHFFELGGHSLLVTQLLARIKAIVGVELTIATVFEAPTIAQLASRIERAMREQRGQKQERPSLLPREGQQEVPLSFAQQRLWFLQQLEPWSTAYHIPHVQRLRGKLNCRALQCSIEELIRRHEVLRTTFHQRAGYPPTQVVHTAGVLQLPIVDMQELDHNVRLNEARTLAKQIILHPFDLEQGPLLRIVLLRLEEQEHVLLAVVHHIISDAWSNGIFVREITQLYQAFVAGRPSPLPPLAIQYADYALWQRQWLQGEALQARLAYWRRQLADVPALELPVDHPRPPVSSHRGASLRFSLSRELSRALLVLSRQEGATLFMTLLAAFQVLLYRYSGQEDIVIGTDSANRSSLETENIIGFFINLLVLRTNLHGRPSFREVLGRVREMVLDAYAHQDTPFELLVERLTSDHALNRMPLIQALFVFQNVPPQREQIAPVGQLPLQEERIEFLPDSELLTEETETAKFDLALFMHEQSESLHGALVYSLDLFDASTIDVMMARFNVMLQSIARQPDTAIDKLDFIAPTEWQQWHQQEQTLRHVLQQHGGGWFDLPGRDLE